MGITTVDVDFGDETEFDSSIDDIVVFGDNDKSFFAELNEYDTDGKMAETFESLVIDDDIDDSVAVNWDEVEDDVCC